MTSQKPAGNDGFDWSEFDPEAYVSHYYREPHEDDERAVRLAVETYRRFSSRRLDVIDIGTGPNLFPLLAALPFASNVTAWEFSARNLAWMGKEIAQPELAPEWLHFWNAVRETAGCETPRNPAPELRHKIRLHQGSIFDLPRHRWDAASMFFCAESITERPEEFEKACRCFAHSVRPAGLLIAAFLAGSRGYEVGDHAFPAVSVTPESVKDLFEALAVDVEIQLVGEMAVEIRSGYSGMIFLTGIAR